MGIEETIMSITNSEDFTGNMNYKDCRIPTDIDVLDAARKYNMSGVIKVTVTSPVGAKTKYTVEVEGNKLRHVGERKYNLTPIMEMAEAMKAEELRKLSQFSSERVSDAMLGELGVGREVIADIVYNKRKSIWKLIENKYYNQMFNYTLAHYIEDRCE